MTEVTTHQTNDGGEESENSTSEDTFVSESSTPVHWTQSSPTQSPVEQDRTDQTNDQAIRHTRDMESTTSSGLSETASTSETTANKAGDIFCLKSSWELSYLFYHQFILYKI